jgi:hypothetical protein
MCMGQTRINFVTRYKELLPKFRNNSYNSKFGQCLLVKGHVFSKINDVMKIMHLIRKGIHMDTMEKFYICYWQNLKFVQT